MSQVAVERLSGAYEGAGAWYDAAHKSATYQIRHTNRATVNGFEVTFRHDFDDGSVVEATFTMTWLAPHVFRVDVAGAPVGNGYLFENVCHYHMKFGDKCVEVTYQSGGAELAVFGSSTANAEGNYIAWKETLRRVAV
jgi:hypothetical protein